MKYKLFRREVPFKIGEIIEFEAPENTCNFIVSINDFKAPLVITGVEASGEGNKLVKRFKLVLLQEGDEVEHTVYYEPRLIPCGYFKYCQVDTYCYLIS